MKNCFRKLFLKKAFKKNILATARNAIDLNIGESTSYVKGGTRFGGLPDVSDDFVWPYFECGTFDDKVVKPRPLNFFTANKPCRGSPLR